MPRKVVFRRFLKFSGIFMMFIGSIPTVPVLTTLTDTTHHTLSKYRERQYSLLLAWCKDSVVLLELIFTLKADFASHTRNRLIFTEFNHSAGKRDRDLTPSPYNARWPEGPRAPLSERSEL